MYMHVCVCACAFKFRPSFAILYCSPCSCKKPVGHRGLEPELLDEHAKLRGFTALRE